MTVKIYFRENGKTVVYDTGEKEYSDALHSMSLDSITAEHRPDDNRVLFLIEK